MRLESASPRETEAAGERLAQRLRPGDVVLVAGELGTGKTTLIRGACAALGVTQPVTSPTFTVGQIYLGRVEGRDVEVAHLDLYRVATLAREDPGLLDDYVTPDRIAFVEWPAVAEPALQAPAATIKIEHAGGDRRLLEIA